MVRNADKVANRDVVPVENTCFLNIPADSQLYTRVGRVIERCAFTELPQLVHVLAGHMSLVGNRPLPENVIAALVKLYPYAEDRFSVRAGLTGPVQLVGRDNLSDGDRLALEIGYCILARSSYRMRLDFLILLHTVLMAVGVERLMTVPAVWQVMISAVRSPPWVCRALGADRRVFDRHASDLMVEYSMRGAARAHVLPAVNTGYGGLLLPALLPPGDEFQLRLADHATEPSFRGRVVWTHDRLGQPKTGIEFVDPPPFGSRLATRLGLSAPVFNPQDARFES